MIRMIQSKSSDHARAYFNDALAKADYYLNDQELQGSFHGLIVERLGLGKEATRQAFFDLCENINPVKGGHLTAKTIDQRTVGYDINFHAPKSVSLVHALSKDDHILGAFQNAVSDTMKDIEADSKTRVRKKGEYDDRETGELLWSEFIHQTARPVDGQLPDPHLHAHCFTFNVTWDDEEKLFKAGQFRDIKRDMPYYEARFHKRLSDNLMNIGYDIRKTDKFFEIDGVPQKAIDLFSKRTNEIGQVAKEKGITNAKDLDALGARTRSKKQKGLTMAELKKEWVHQLKSADLDQENKTIRNAKKEIDTKQISPEQSIDFAVKHRFERMSVIHDRRILEAAYRYAIGHVSAGIEQITQRFKSDKRIIHVKEKWKTLCTTKEVLAEEKHMVDLANQGKGKVKPLYLNEPKINLKGEQYEAVRHVLMTPNRVSIIRGRAGTGKTTLMKEAVSLIETAGRKVTVVAPTAQASRGVLKEEGFKDATTVASLLKDRDQQSLLDGQVILVDEAGLLGTKDMTELLELAQRKDARLILSGDTRQHASVIRGDALRVLNTVGGIKAAEVSRIYRQKPAAYREAVQSLSEGKIIEAFSKLDNLKAIKTIDPLQPNDQLVNDYVQCIKRGKSALVVSPTHKQGEDTTRSIRAKLRAEKMIGKKDVSVKRLINLNMTEAQKCDARNYKIGQAIQFNQNITGIKRGSVWSVTSVRDGQLEAANQDGKIIAVPLSASAKLEVYHQTEIELAKGDKILVTRNGFDTDRKELSNGKMLEVVSIGKHGNIKARNAVSKTIYNLPRDYGHISHAHCITSHSAQGKTVDEVFIAQPSSTFPATDMKQFYVSASRGRERVSIYTDDKVALLDHASHMGDRQSALELVKHRTEEMAERISRENMNRQNASTQKARAQEKTEPLKKSHYEREPEI